MSLRHGSSPGNDVNAGKDMSREATVLFCCHLAPRNICLLRFLLEGYDGLATMTTVSAAAGLVYCLASGGQGESLRRLLEDFSAEGLIYSFVRVNAFELRRCLLN
ncbi:MAG: hypothetical protein DRH04_00330 [Deltaproteobacteria bacterium]|nr:MAG: hypothetical protein DRH04_00330 [Deltaproteobacteria bacterium]